MDTQRKITLTVLVLAVVAAIVWLEVIKPHQGPTITAQQAALNDTSTNTVAGSSTSTSPANDAIPGSLTPAQFLSSRADVVRQESTQYSAAPEITDPTGWINAQPFTLASLIGQKVVLIDFWTYSCINCVRTIPYINAWYAKYKDAGLVIVGVHTPEFQFEHDINNVQMAVKNLGIQYPVVLDSNMGTWNAYQNLYWPNEYLINIDGFIVHNSVGEGNYQDTETAIQNALKERATALGLPTSIVPTGFVSPSGTINVSYSGVQTAETYFGAARNQYLANGPVMTNGTYPLTTPSSTDGNGFYLNGTWDFEDQYATNKTAGATITYQYSAKNVYFVASAATPTPVQVFVDGKLNGTVTIQGNQLYNLVQGADYGTHTLKLVIPNAGLDAYTFTFG